MNADQVRDLVARAREAELRLVRFLFCDNSNVIRGKVCHVDSLDASLTSGIGLTVAMQGFTATERIAPGAPVGPVGEIRLTPDPDTFSVRPYSPRNAHLLCDLTTLAGEAWELCPRAALRRVVARAAEMGFRLRAGFENEFYLARPTANGYEPFDRTACYSSVGMDLADAVIGEVVDGLGAQGLRVAQYHPELGPGQQELSLHPDSPLRAADAQIALRETVRGVAQRHELVASFAPKPFAGEAGSGCHLHLSLWHGDENLFASPDGAPLEGPAKHFVAGILDHAPALLAVTCPSLNSYERLQPSSWSSAFVCYGADNREAMVRIPSVFRGRESESANMELKAIDGSANPYLALAAVISAGLDGVTRALDPGPPLEVDPSELSVREREERGIAPYPQSLPEALEAFAADDLGGAFDPALHQTILAVRRAEWEDLHDRAPAEIVATYFDRY